MKLTSKFKKAKVLCIGDIMLDRFSYGHVERISPEAPVPILRVDDENIMLGGSGNVVRNLSALGATAYFLSAIGNDSAAREVQFLLDDQNIKSNLISEENRKTTIKTRFISGNHHLLRVDSETVVNINNDSEKEIFQKAQELLKHVHVLILSDYAKGVLTPMLTSTLIRVANQQGVTIIVDPKGKDYSKYRNATIITPNLKELHDATGQSVSTDEDIIIAAQKLMREFNFENVLVTRSQDGMSLLSNSGDFYHLHAEAKEVFDVSGAGDTVVATLATSLSSGFSLCESAKIANIAAGIVVGKVGTAVVHANEIKYSPTV